ncbi:MULTISPECIES: EthD family reductase [Pseudomonas]|uniref:EthD family reductase n=1 Tax=Pseudomonas TaxID=286 RepID=UPI00093A7458|nr:MULTISPECIES: EthD family reductase [Pseudomonas]MDH0639311.1 EthD family reductase [Pseudomonas sp. GD03860]
MINVQIMYPAGGSFDWDYYIGTHMPMAERELRPVEWSVFRGTNAGIPLTYVAVASIIFTDTEAWEAAFARAGAELLADIPNYTDITPILQVSERIAKS